MGRQYEYDEWFEFLTASDDQPDYAKETQQKFEDQVSRLLDSAVVVGIISQDEYDDLDIKEVAFLTYASLGGHGIGLWEGREDWHEDFEELLVAKDKRLKDLFYQLESEAEYGE